MCRNIKTLHHFEPPATEEEIRASALQYVRKLSGMNTPSKANRAAFDAAVETITRTTLDLFEKLEPRGPLRSREAEKLKAAERGKKRDDQVRRRLLAGA
ncbi:MAG TPA: DUF2277 domain-containing protein [Kofleriaceae bacterium]|nr:DUF2277 domain-containing protein [Kofleriaceae bacterium]